jgi:Tfp pilus assembly protein PilN
MEPRLNELKASETRINAIKADIKRQDDLAAPFVAAVRDREYWVKLIDDINSRLPPDYIWVTQLKIHDKSRTAPTPPPGGKGGAPAAKEPSVVLMLEGMYLDNPRQQRSLTISSRTSRIADVPAEQGNAGWVHSFHAK